jgi:hypothetical protein
MRSRAITLGTSSENNGGAQANPKGRDLRSRDRYRKQKNPRLESGVLLGTLPRIGLLRVGLARSSTVTSGRAARQNFITGQNPAGVLSCSLALFYFSGDELIRKARQTALIGIDCPK